MGCKIIAHRGASGLAKYDNSLGSFRKAIEIGADMIEFDVRRTKDGKLVAFHDPDIDGRKISSLTYSKIVKISEGTGFKVPLVGDVINLSKGKVGLDIELKEGGYEDILIKMVRDHLDHDEFIMKSFSDRTVKAIKRHDPKIRTGLLLGVENPKNKLKTRLSELFPGKRLKRCGADFVSPNYQLLKLFFMRRMKDRDIYVWTVNDIGLMEKLIKKGVGGIITDRPDLAVTVRKMIDP